jgi:hypothetical protein
MHADHAEELKDVVAQLGRLLARFAPTVDDETKAVIATFSGRAVVEAYRLGLRHAICDLISTSIDGDHPAIGAHYVIEARLALPEEAQAASEAMSRIVDAAGRPDSIEVPLFPSRDHLN